MTKSETLGGMTASQWGAIVKYEADTGKLVWQEGERNAGKRAGTWHKAAQCWMILRNGKYHTQKAVKHLLTRGWVPADQRLYPIVCLDGDPDNERPDNLLAVPRREAYDLARVRRVEKRKADYQAKAENSPRSEDVGEDRQSNPRYPGVTAMDTVEQAAEKMLAMAKMRHSHTLKC